MAFKDATILMEFLGHHEYTGSPVLDSGQDTIQYKGLINQNYTVGVTTTGVVTAGVITISGTTVMDLTALVDAQRSGTVSLSGLKVLGILFKNPSTHAITITFGAATAYLLGGAAFKWILQPGQSLMVFGNAATPTVSGSLKNMDVSGTDADTLDYWILAG